jgi:hypothetical protein
VRSGFTVLEAQWPGKAPSSHNFPKGAGQRVNSVMAALSNVIVKWAIENQQQPVATAVQQGHSAVTAVNKPVVCVSMEKILPTRSL